MDVDKAKKLMKEMNLDALIINSPQHIFYASGFRCFDQIISREAQVFLIIPAQKEKESYLVAPHSDRFILIDNPIWVKNTKWYGTYYVKDAEDYAKQKVRSPFEGLFQSLKELDLEDGTIGIEEDLFPISVYEKLKTELPEIQIRDGSNILKDLRMIKNAEEIRRIRIATEITEKAVYAVGDAIMCGIKEIELEKIFLEEISKKRAYLVYIQIGAGMRGAYGSGVYPTECEIKKGDVVRIDASVSYENYVSDVCKIFAAREASSLARKYYKVASEAEKAAINAIKPGVKASEIFEKAVEVPHKLGYLDYYRHHVGHGIGLSPHERPILEPQNYTKISPNMVLCIEAPYYVWGLGGFSPEDTVIVTEEGYDLLTKFEEELLVK